MKLMSFITKLLAMYTIFTQKFIRATVFLVFVFMAFFLFSVSPKENAIMDELAHIPSGYSYLTQQDMRLNPEHPPILKDLSALPLLFMNLHFPTDLKAWTTDINGQWEMGTAFLYNSGNDPDAIVYWARIGPIILTLLLAFFVFKFGSEFFGEKVGLIALILFAFSPAVLAHGKYVTTDVAAAFGFFTATFYFLRYLKDPVRKNLWWAGIFFGIAQGLKFSTVLLIPFFIGIAWLWSRSETGSFWRWMGRTCAIIAIGYLAVIWPLYQFHVWNYPASMTPAEQAIIVPLKTCDDQNMDNIHVSQTRDAECNLKKFRVRPLAHLIVWMSDKPLLRPFAQYATGVFMVGKRVVGGNTTYFLGDVARNAWWYYFPVIYLIKEPLAAHVLTLTATIIMLTYLYREKFFTRSRTRQSWRDFIQEHFVPFIMFLLVIYYWTVSMVTNLNIGIRHIIPTMPFIFLLVAHIILSYLGRKPMFEGDLSLNTVKRIASFYFTKAWHYVALCLVLFWYIMTTAAHYPYFTSYFNELVGGPANGYKYVADSNVDWGQDLKRLAQFVKDKNIDKIRLNYFGGGSPAYYLGDAYVSWWSSKGSESGWHAVSATFLDEAFGRAVGNYSHAEQDTYPWLKGRTPVTVIGNSIVVYHLE